ncbi:hypothetical protein BJ165DRAFT_1499888 [Panaeolus papilionaceus]|nr:hypothetical protein BJ165DRAFT_1499888 [Panaeolus papilionaceus]
MSERQFGVKTVREAKRVLEEELEGVIHDFEPGRIEVLLEKAASLEECKKYLRSRSRNSAYAASKWTKLPDPTEQMAEEGLYQPLVETFQSILDYFKLQYHLLVRDTHRSPIVLNNIEQLKAVPDIFITGDGEHFSGDISDLAFQQCITSVEVKTEQTKNDNDKWLAQVAYYARQCLVAQPTRSFVYGLLITQRNVQVYRFDRCGVQRSEWMEYHGRNNAHILIQVLLLVCNPDLEKLGVDTTVRYVDQRPVFTLIRKNQPFVLAASHRTPRFQALGIRGRSTVCWTVYDEKGDRYVLKQQFVNTCRTREDIILSEIKEKKIQGVGMSFHWQSYELVSKSREMQLPLNPAFHDRYMYRLILEEHGDTIDTVTSRMSLLLALRDAIQAHRDLWAAGILHRDISTNNILYTNDGQSGVLIDFDLAINILRKTSNFRADFRTGTRAFQSVSVLKSYQPEGGADKHILHDYLDDLESFYWVLVWITKGQLGPEKRKLPSSKLDKNLEVYDLFQAPAGPAADRKYMILSAAPIAKIQEGWGPAYEKLVRNLGSFLHPIASSKILGTVTPLDELIANAPADYEKYLRHFDVAIAELKEELDRPPENLQPPDSDPAPRARAQSLPNTTAPLSPIPLPVFAPKESLKRTRDEDDAQPDRVDVNIDAAAVDQTRATSSKRARTKSTPVNGLKKSGRSSSNPRAVPLDPNAPPPRRSTRLSASKTKKN